MTSTVQEHWQLIEDILKKDRSRPQGDQLRACVAGLLTTADGRESIRKRLNGEGGKFAGRQRFVDEVVRVLDSPAPLVAAISPRDRLAIQEVVLKRTKPAVDPAHWDILWLLHRDGYLGAGQLALESLAKVTRKGEDLLRTLPNLQAWQRVAPDRILALLEAAKKATRDVELSNRIERVIPWARGRRSGTEWREPPARRPAAQSQAGRLVDEVSTDQAGAPTAPAATPGQAAGASLSTDPLAVSQDAARAVPMLLKAVEELFHQQEARQTELQQCQDAAREELAAARAELQCQRNLVREHAGRAASLEQALSERARNLAAAREQIRNLEQQLAEARQEAGAAHRRAEDYIHEATLARDNAVRGFQAALWDRIKSCLVEILDDGHHDGLTPDQVFFRHRLHEIRDALRDQGVPPY